MSRIPALTALALSLTLFPIGARAACPPVTPVACPDCFAVFVMPDTQHYSELSRQPHGAAHLDLVTRYVCDNATDWTEPRSGKQMPIAMVIQLGDLVEHGDRAEGQVALAEWRRVDAAFDRLDACAVPYLVTMGNHDYATRSRYEEEAVGFETFFGVDRWLDAGYGCATPDSCSGLPDDWFVGGGDPILAGSRNNADGAPGPAVDYGGRHRTAVVRAPDGQRFLFLGLEAAFDFPPAAPGFEGIEGNDAAWPHQILAAYADLPTVVFHHSMFITSRDPNYTWGIEGFRSDSIPDGPVPDGMIHVWNELIDPTPQIFAVFSGHVLRPAPLDDFTIARSSGPPVAGFLRNFQEVGIFGAPHRVYGVGWNVVAVFDPAAGEVRVRSYRVDDTDAYADPPVDFDHSGTPAPTECLDVDQAGVGERVIPFPSVPTAPTAGGLSGAPSGGRVVLLVALVGAVLWLVARRPAAAGG